MGKQRFNQGKRPKMAQGLPSQRTKKSRNRSARVRSKLKRTSPKKVSVFAKLMPSKGDLSLRKMKNEPFIGANYIAALIFLAILILFGGGSHVFTLGFALIITGVLMLRRPPIYGLGPWFDSGALLFVLGGVLTFFVSTGSLSIELTDPLNSELVEGIHRHYWLGLEEFCIVLTCLAWLYLSTNSRLNSKGRLYVYTTVAFLGLLLGAISILGNYHSWSFPGSAEGIGFSFFAEEGQMATLLLTIGIFSFCFGLESLVQRSPLHLVGILGGMSCFFALMISKNTDQLIFFFIGLAIYYVTRLWVAELKIMHKIIIGFIFACTLFVILSNYIEIAKLAEKTLVPVDAWGIFWSNPFLGVGLGHYDDWIPLFREVPISAYKKAALPNDFLWLLAGLGISGLCAVSLMLIGFLKELRLSQIIRPGAYRFIPLIAVCIYILFGFKGYPRHAIALVFLVLFFLALALPIVDRKSNKIPKWFWSGCGFVLIGIGSLWVLGAVFSMPFHSSIYKEKQEALYQKASKQEDWYEALEKLNVLSRLEPFNWKWYGEKGKIALELSDLDGARNEFKRASIVEPHYVESAYNAGYEWLELDLREAEKMWLIALDKSGKGAAELYEQLLIEGAENYRQTLVLERISKANPRFGVIWLESLDKTRFEQAVSEYLDSSDALAQFNKEERMRIFDRWVNFGDSEHTDRFLKKYPASVTYPWYLQSHVLKNSARFEEAAGILRRALKVPVLPKFRYSPSNITLLEREIAAEPTGFKKRLQMISLCVKQKDYLRGLELVEKYLRIPGAPIELYFWEGEFNFQKEDFVNSWLSFDAYARKMLNLKK